MEWFETAPEQTHSLTKLMEYHRMVLGKMEFYSDVEAVSTLPSSICATSAW